MYNFAESVLCTFLLLVGIVLIAIYALMTQEDRIFKLLIYGVVSTAISILMMMWHNFFVIVLSIIVGLGGVVMLIDSIKTKKKAQGLWITDFVIGLIVIVMSLTTIILSSTNAAKLILSIFFGVILLIQGVYGLIQLINICKKEKLEKQENKLEQKEEPKAKEKVEDHEKFTTDANAEISKSSEPKKVKKTKTKLNKKG